MALQRTLELAPPASRAARCGRGTRTSAEAERPQLHVRLRVRFRVVLGLAHRNECGRRPLKIAANVWFPVRGAPNEYMQICRRQRWRICYRSGISGSQKQCSVTRTAACSLVCAARPAVLLSIGFGCLSRCCAVRCDAGRPHKQAGMASGACAKHTMTDGWGERRWRCRCMHTCNMGRLTYTHAAHACQCA